MTADSLTDSLRETLDVFDGERRGTPLTTAEVADHLSVGRRSAYARLERLAARDRLETKKVGARGRVWWRAGASERERTTPGADALERQFRSLVDAAEEYAVVGLDADGRVRTWNEGAERIHGHAAAEIVGERVGALYADEDRAAGVPERALATAAADGAAADEGWRVRGDGTRFWARVAVTPVRDDAGDVRGYVAATRDMTGRRERERALRRERDLLEKILEMSPVGISVLTPDGERTHLNERTQELLELPAERVDSYAPTDRVVYDADGRDVSLADHPTSRTLATGEPVRDWRAKVELPDGGDRWLSVNSVPIFDEDGDVERVVATAEDITPLKERTESLERQRDELESELERVFERVDDGFYALDEEWRFTYVNDRAEDLLGRSAGDLMGRVIWDVFPNLRGDEGEEAFRRAAASQASVTYEEYFEPIDAWFEVRAYPSETGLSVYFRDVTGRKRRERELERYETIVETVEDGIYAVDEDARFQLVNEGFCKLTGRTREELLGAHATTVHADEITPKARRMAAEIVAGERDLARIELDIHTKAGDAVPCESRLAPFPTGDGYGRCGVIRDVSDRLERERALEQSERRYRTLVDNFPNGAVALFDEELRYLLVGGEAFDGVDFSAAELEGDTVTERLPADLAEEIEPRYRAVFEGEADEFDVEFEGEIRHFRALPVTDERGTVSAGLAVSQDITRQVERERELERRHEQLAALNNLGRIVHEITDAVIEQSTREEIEAIACRRLAESDSYLSAWIGDADVQTQTITPRTASGAEGPLDGIAFSTAPDDERGAHPAARAILRREIQTARGARERGLRSSASIPIVHEEAVFGVLHVSADRPAAFAADEQAVIGRLGEVIGHAIAAVERKRALMSDEVVELEFRIRDAFGAIGVTASPDGSITLDRAVPIGGGDFLVYGSATGDAMEGVAAVVASASVPHWRSVTVLDGGGAETRFELKLTEPSVLSAVAAHGGDVKEARIEGGDYYMRIHLAPSADVRSVADAVRNAYPTVEHVAQRQLTRDRPSSTRLRAPLFAELTERQRSAVEAAYRAGYFAWPRTSTGEDVADSLGVSPATFHQHLRRAQEKLLAALFVEPLSADGPS